MGRSEHVKPAAPVGTDSTSVTVKNATTTRDLVARPRSRKPVPHAANKPVCVRTGRAISPARLHRTASHLRLIPPAGLKRASRTSARRSGGGLVAESRQGFTQPTPADWSSLRRYSRVTVLESQRSVLGSHRFRHRGARSEAGITPGSPARYLCVMTFSERTESDQSRE